MSYSAIYYHIVIRTYRSVPTIDEANERELYGYILGMCRNLDVTLIRIGGMPDHIHLLVGVPPTLCVAEFVRRLKRSTSSWLKTKKDLFPNFDSWSNGYAAFSYSRNDLPTIKQYIMNQKTHHHSVSFIQEYREWLASNGITIDDRYFMKDDE